jgi:sugar phosphate isomerase/epimerase
MLLGNRLPAKKQAAPGSGSIVSPRRRIVYSASDWWRAMKFAICNETFQDWPLDRALRFARECGYAGIEFAPFTIHKNAYEISATERESVRRLAEGEKLEVVGLHWLLAFTHGYYLTSPDAGVRQETSEYLGELARLCRDLGGRILVLGSPKQRNLLPGVSHDAAMHYAAEVIQRAVPAFLECGVVLAVEPLGPEEGDFLRTADLGQQLMEMVDSPACRLHLDVKAMASEGQPIPDIIRRHAGHMAHFHANDSNRRGPGMGHIDFVPILTTLKEVGFDGWVSVEVFDYAPGVEALARDSIQYLQKCWAQVRAS